MENSVLLQHRQIQVQLIDLCKAMDLVAIVTTEGYVVVHRTISW